MPSPHETESVWESLEDTLERMGLVLLPWQVEYLKKLYEEEDGEYVIRSSN